MMSDLTVDRISKRYQLKDGPAPHQRPRTALRRMLHQVRPPAKDFWALRDVSFEVARGETIGIIGDNGAGKSTILKLLSGITSPTQGRISVRGRMSALIEVGSGFHPDLTGRENVYLSGSILGMRRREINDKLERIVEFAGVREFIDTPVKRYSSGMYLRLGFAIAAHLEPDILLLDEVLAVGDAAFQAKCLTRVDELHRDGRTIVFISHDLGAVERLCRRVLLLTKGRVAADGPAREVVELYREQFRGRIESETPPAEEAPADEAEIVSVTCVGRNGEPVTVVRSGEPLTLRVHYRCSAAAADARMDVYLFTMLDDRFGPWCHLTTAQQAHSGLALSPGEGVIEFTIDHLGLLKGRCRLAVEIAHEGPPPPHSMGRAPNALELEIEPGPPVRGTFYMPHQWRIAGGSAARIVPRP